MLAVVGASLVSGERVSLTGLGRSREFPQLSAVSFLAYNVVSFGYGEEVGWRGFALPRLQARHSAFVASLLLTLGWALWHAPLFLYRPGYTSMNAAGVAGWLFSLVTGAVLLTWLYNGARVASSSPRSSTLPSTSPSPRPFPRRWWSTSPGHSSQCAESSSSSPRVRAICQGGARW